MRIQSLGDSGLVVSFGDHFSEDSLAQVDALYSTILVAKNEAIRYCIPAYHSLTIHFDNALISYEELSNWVRSLSAKANTNRTPRIHEIEVSYDETNALDKEFISQHSGLHWEDVIAIHSQPLYTVFMLGFMPGFAYLGSTDKAIHMPRKKSPRLLVPRGSVGLAGNQTAIYPVDSPGGWQIIGKGLVDVFDMSSENPFLFSPFDKVKFIPKL